MVVAMARRMRVNVGIGRASGVGRAGSADSYVDPRTTMKAIQRELNSIFDQLQNASEDLMLEAMEPTFKKARDVYAPVLTGDLRASGYLEKVGFRGKPRVEIGFGRNGNPDYAAFVHEAVDIPHRSPTRSKFLQAAVMEDLDQIYRRLGDAYKQYTGL